MEIRSSKLFKRQVADLVCYLKVTFGKRIAFRVKNEIEEKVFLLKLFPNMGTVESLLEEEPVVSEIEDGIDKDFDEIECKNLSFSYDSNNSMIEFSLL